MKKKDIILQIEQVTQNNSKLFKKNRELELSLEERDKQIADMQVKLTELTSKLDELNIEHESLKVERDSLLLVQSNVESVNFEVVDDSEVVRFGVIENEDLKNKTASESIIDDNLHKSPIIPMVPEVETVLLEQDAVKIASKAIGRVVLLCAQACDVFMKNGNQNSKDLINLALGRSEVFKSEALALVKNDLSQERLTAELNAKEAEVSEYFQILLQQI